MKIFNQAGIEKILTSGVSAGAFPGAVAMWGKPDAPQMAWAGLRGLSRNKEPVSCDLIYDLASLTKVLSTTTLAMIMVKRGRLDLDQPLSEIFKFAPSSTTAQWHKITPAHLLSHQSGLRPWWPFYRLSETGRRQKALEAIQQQQPQGGPGQRTIYSDLNFILLGFLIEQIEAAPLDHLFKKEVAGPLNLKHTRYCPTSGLLAPTEDGFRYGGPTAHPEASLLGATALGRPHDDNAVYFNGVAGHAGLFAPAAEIWAIAADWNLAFQSGEGLIFNREILKKFIQQRPTTEDPGRPLGFNIRSEVKSMSRSALSPNAVGHLGYTGTSLWWDFEKNFIWLLLTNRVHPSARNTAWIASKYVGGPLNFKSCP